MIGAAGKTLEAWIIYYIAEASVLRIRIIQGDISPKQKTFRIHSRECPGSSAQADKFRAVRLLGSNIEAASIRAGHIIPQECLRST